MAPSYWPQVGHAVCGGFIAPQARLLHGASVGAAVFHWERRWRVGGLPVGSGGVALADSGSGDTAEGTSWCAFHLARVRAPLPADDIPLVPAMAPIKPKI